MGELLTVVCVAIAVGLVAAQVYVTVKPRTSRGGGAEDFPGGDVVKTMIEKAPLLGAAFAFMVLAGVFDGLINFGFGS